MFWKLLKLEWISIIGMDLNSFKKEIVAFLILTFGLTYLLNFFVWNNNYFLKGQIEFLYHALTLEMFIPAFSAIILNLFIFKSKTYTRKVKIFFYYFLFCTAVSAASFVLLLALGLQLGFVNYFIIVGLFLIIILHLKAKWREELRVANLSFGNQPLNYLWFWILIVGFFLINAFLNCYLDLGTPIKFGFKNLLVPGFSMTILVPIAGLAGGLFGEEYGWRIFLQDRLTRLFGRFRGVLMVGIIWGLWHAPIVARFGWTYPGYPRLGTVLFIVFTIEWSIILGLAVFKTGSVWIAAFLHGAINNTADYGSIFICSPTNPVYSFGYGIYGLIVLAIIGLILFKSKSWKTSG